MNQKPKAAESTVGRVGTAETAALNTLRSRLMPLVYRLEVMKNEMASSPDPPNWPSIQRSTATVTNLLNSIHTLLHDDPETTKLFASLHAYPISPFPVNDPQLFTVAMSHLRKMPEPHDQDWVEARIAKAGEFAHVPEEWGIEARKPDEEQGGEAKDDGADVGVAARVKRVRGDLDEDQIAQLWADAADIVESEIAKVEPDAGSDGDEEGDEDEDEEMGGMSDQADAAAAAAKKVALQPLLPLEAMQRFMMTGAPVASASK